MMLATVYQRRAAAAARDARIFTNSGRYELAVSMQLAAAHWAYRARIFQGVWE